MISVVIVGSSDVVHAQKRGHLIDTFDRVVRFNRAPLKGFEEVVGTKTHERWVNPEVLNGEEHEGRTLLPFDEVEHERIVSHSMIAPEKFYGIWGTTNSFQFVQPEYWKTCLRSVKIEPKHVNPTMGFQAICYWLHAKPTIIGFDLEPRLHHHYWRPEVRNSTFHDHKWEKATLKKLIERNLVKI